MVYRMFHKTITVSSHLYDAAIVVRKHCKIFVAGLRCSGSEAASRDLWRTAEETPIEKELIKLATSNLGLTAVCSDPYSSCTCRRRGMSMQEAAAELARIKIILVGHSLLSDRAAVHLRALIGMRA